MSDTTTAAGFATVAIHAGAQPDLVHAFPLPTSGHSIDAASLGDPVGPSVASLEERIAALEGGTAAVAVASGRAARLLAFHALMQPGDELVAGRRPNHELLDASFRAFGWRICWADANAPESFVEALSDRTKAILVDSIATPDGVTDIEAIATIARRARIPLVVDNTLATPYLVRPLEHGADIVLHTSGGLIGGAANAPCGIVVDGGSFSFANDPRYPALSQPACDGLAIAETYGNYAFAMRLRLGLHDLGGPPSPFAAYLVAAGLETLSLRLQRQSDSALAVAHHLSRHPKVAWVRYAGLERDAGHALAQRYCPKGAGAGLAFALTDAAAAAIIGRLRLIAPASEIGGARSLVHPCAAPLHDAVGLTIGLEDPADIIADLDQAMG